MTGRVTITYNNVTVGLEQQQMDIVFWWQTAWDNENKQTSRAATIN